MNNNTTDKSQERNMSNEELIAQRIADLTPIVAANLRKLIETRGITQKTLSQQIGYSESAISKYMTGKSFPQLDFFFQLKKYYDISIDDFLSKEINEKEINTPISLSILEQEEEKAYSKICGTYLVYYLDTSNYKGRDDNSPDESLTFGVMKIYETKTTLDKPDYSCLSIFGISDRQFATELRNQLDSLTNNTDAENYVISNERLSNKLYFGDFEMSADHAFISLTHNRKDKALIILHRVVSNKKEYIGGMGTINSVSRGRESMPTAQYMALSRYPITLSDEEIHHNLLLSHPTYKADKHAKELISLFKKTYMMPDPDDEEHTELEKELIMKVNLERYVKESLTKNMFRYAKISERDDGAWYKLLKEVSIIDEEETDSESSMC